MCKVELRGKRLQIYFCLLIWKCCTFSPLNQVIFIGLKKKQVIFIILRAELATTTAIMRS